MALPIRATLGGIPFHGWTGFLHKRLPITSTFSRIGQEGSGAEVTGIRSDPMDCGAWIACSSQTDAKDKSALVEDLCGKVVALLDPWGRNIAKVRVTKSKATPKAASGPGVTTGTSSTHIVSCEFELEPLP